MKMLVPLFALVLLASSARGALGETETELAKRYGKQTKTGTSHLPGVTIQGFEYGPIQIVVGVLNGRSAFEMYSKKNQAKLSATEVAALMNANAFGHAWNEDTASHFNGKRWILDDDAVIAEFSSTAQDLTVMTRAAQDLLNADKPAGKPANKPAPTPAKK